MLQFTPTTSQVVGIKIATVTFNLNVVVNPSVSLTGTLFTGLRTYYIHSDHLDSPRSITNTAGQEVWRWDNTDPFGNNIANENPANQGTFTFNLRFPGQYFDRETGLHYNVNRDYNLNLGRYIESDPIGLMGGINTFGYVGGNPLSYTDPYGLIANPAEGACVFGPNPVCAGGIAVDMVTSAIAMAMASRAWFDHPEAKRQYDEYNERKLMPPPPGLDPCELLKWKLKKEEDMLKSRQDWDAKWVPQGAQDHSKAIQQSKNEIKNLKDKMKKNGCGCP